jgi:hypothetical protein
MQQSQKFAEIVWENLEGIRCRIAEALIVSAIGVSGKDSIPAIGTDVESWPSLA